MTVNIGVNGFGCLVCHATLENNANIMPATFNDQFLSLHYTY